MNAHTRRAVAYIAGRAVAPERTANTIYDYGAAAYFNFSGEVSADEADEANVFDYETKRYIKGTLTRLFHYGNSRYIELKLGGDGTFEGFDYASSRHFSGKVEGDNISLFDYDGSRYYNFKL